MSDLRIGCSPITNTIYAGKVNKNGMWIGEKQDVTDDAVKSVAENLVRTDECFRFTFEGKRYELKVSEINK